MVFHTPQPSDQKERFMKPTRLEYYEDLYGEANPDEEFDRFPDDCEEESSSSEGESTTTNNNRESEKKQEGFFARFRKRKPEQSASDLVESRVFGKGKRSEDSRVSNSSTNIITTQRKRSPKRKKLTPRKGGLFASSMATMDFDSNTPNSAGEMMEDMFRAGAESAIDFDEGYADDAFTRQLQQAAYPQIDPELLAANDTTSNSTIERHAAEDGDVEDNTDATAFEKPAKGKGAKKATSILSSALAAHKPGAAKANTKSKLDKAPLLPSRLSSRITKPEPAKKKSAVKAKAAEIQAKTSDKTTRAVTTHNKPAMFQVKRMSAKELSGGRGGRNVRLRSWKGDVIKQDDERGIVVVFTDEEDAEDYVRVG